MTMLCLNCFQPKVTHLTKRLYCYSMLCTRLNGFDSRLTFMEPSIPPIKQPNTEELTLLDAIAEVVAFARTAPGRLPQRVTNALTLLEDHLASRPTPNQVDDAELG